MRRRLPEVLEDAENELPVEGRALLRELGDDPRRLDERVGEYDAQLAATARVPAANCHSGIGELSATTLVAAVDDAKEFRDGPEMAAWLSPRPVFVPPVGSGPHVACLSGCPTEHRPFQRRRVAAVVDP